MKMSMINIRNKKGLYVECINKGNVTKWIMELNYISVYKIKTNTITTMTFTISIQYVHKYD